MKKLTIDDEVNIDIFVDYHLGLTRIGINFYPISFLDREDVQKRIKQRLEYWEKQGVDISNFM